MGQYIGFHVDGDPTNPRRATPISTGATHDEAFACALQRMLTLPVRGHIEVCERDDVSSDAFATLTATLDAHFAKHMFGKSPQADLEEEP